MVQTTDNVSVLQPYNQGQEPERLLKHDICSRSILVLMGFLASLVLSTLAPSQRCEKVTAWPAGRSLLLLGKAAQQGDRSR
mmetsp:Transcript_69374/g.137153  ORF Transcript_69374/g.137153 Transcript_69374/m.137153 type:complete len:81 (+) Transcript_69374:89-331(+)